VYYNAQDSLETTKRITSIPNSIHSTFADLTIQLTMAHQHCDMPCSVPPHPRLLARTKANLLSTEAATSTEAEKNAAKILVGEKGMPGMNDGTIFPSSHYTPPKSIMAMTNAGLERKPLRGTIRYAS
jgi:immune inhibitor A